MSYRRETRKPYDGNSTRKHRARSSSQKKDLTQLSVKTFIEKTNIRGGELFCQELLRKVGKEKERIESIDPRSFNPREHGLIQVHIKGNPRAKVFMRPHKLQIIDTSYE